MGRSLLRISCGAVCFVDIGGGKFLHATVPLWTWGFPKTNDLAVVMMQVPLFKGPVVVECVSCGGCGRGHSVVLSALVTSGAGGSVLNFICNGVVQGGFWRCSGVALAVGAGLVAFEDHNRVLQKGGGILDIGSGKAFVFTAGDLDFLVLLQCFVGGLFRENLPAVEDQQGGRTTKKSAAGGSAYGMVL